MTVIDDRLSQRRAALVAANRARMNMAALKQELHALGRVASAHRLADLLDRQDDVVMRMRVQDTLTAVRGIRQSKARTITREARISIGSTRIDALSPRQRNVIAGLLRGVH